MRLIVASLVVALAAVACSEDPAPTPIPPTRTPAPTATGTATPLPPTATVTPTSTPTPDPTATPTPLPPTVTPSATPSPTPDIPTPTPTFSPGPVILPTVEIPVRTPTPTPTAKELLSRKLDAIGFRTSLVRDLSARGPMERELIDKDRLATLLKERLEEDQDDLLVTQKLYETLGIIDEGTDLATLMSSATSDIALGLYDSDSGKLYVVADEDDFQPQDALTVAHEFTHGLQQLNFDIRDNMESLRDNSDRAMAFAALVEGDATLTQLLYMVEHMDEEEQAIAQSAVVEADISAYLAAPLVIRRSIAFPYAEGPPFVIELYLRTSDFQWVNRAYEYLPQSTEQVMHIEKYDAMEAPVHVPLPPIASALGEGWTELERDTMGELFIGSYLGSVVGAEASAVAAAGWGGDRYALLEHQSGDRLFASVITWDSEVDAAEFYKTYQEMASGRLGGTWQERPSNGSTLIMEDADQFAVVNLDGLESVIVLSVDSETGLRAFDELRPAGDD